MILTFTPKEPKFEVVDQESADLYGGGWEPVPYEDWESFPYESYADAEDPDETPQLLSFPAEMKLFANYTRYFGHVELADGSSRLHFVVKSSATYLACKESHAFLRFIFAEPVRPSGGFPSWFRFDMDTIRCSNYDVCTISTHAWFTQTQHLIIAIGLETSYYFEFANLSDTNPYGDECDAEWIGNNLPVLNDIAFEMLNPEIYGRNGRKHTSEWLDGWIDIFEKWYNCKYGSEPVSWYAQVISNRIPEEEWLTPTNYLRLHKVMLQEHNKRYFPDEDWKPQDKKILDILEATDEELESPAEFLEKHRPSWDD
jgi:hypothetical protein